jgi:hypothetical protein
MQYQCSACGTSQWRGFFPEKAFHLRYAVFHGVALGICGTATKILSQHLGYTVDGWRGGLRSLAICAAFLLVFYAVAITLEVCIVAFRSCRACGKRGLRLR